LSRLGTRRRARLAPPGIRVEIPQASELGQEIRTPQGPAYRIESRYPLEHAHGPVRLSELLSFDPGLAADVAGRPDLASTSLSHLTFLDTETTGLAGGAGTLVFLVGVGRFDPEGFRLRQYLLRNPADEAAMLEALEEDLAESAGFITFNGQAFDLPLLEMRYLLGLRRRRKLTALPHLDLLHPARRLWRRSLPDCSLSTLEHHMLGIVRSEADVPGDLIPGIYLDYLRTGDTAGMSRVVYHNAVDVLSMVGLTTQVLRRHGRGELDHLSGPEALAVARWHQRAGRLDPAETAFQLALTSSQESTLQAETLRRYATQLRRQGRWAEAANGWEGWHTLEPENPEPCLELAKYFEWRAHNPLEARRWAEAALVALTHWQPGWRRDEAWAAVENRLRRLSSKIGA
jgi:uncharacterized protein YprB with RNaseH-like and TPR domain